MLRSLLAALLLSGAALAADVCDVKVPEPPAPTGVDGAALDAEGVREAQRRRRYLKSH